MRAHPRYGLHDLRTQSDMDRLHRGTDHVPKGAMQIEKEQLPKSLSRVLDAAKLHEAYKKRKRENENQNGDGAPKPSKKRKKNNGEDVKAKERMAIKVRSGVQLDLGPF